MTFKTGRTIKRSAAALVAAVVVATVMVAGGGLATNSPAPAEASAIHIAATQEPVPASNAQPTARVAGRFLAIPFYIQGFRNWNGQWCSGLFNDRGQLVSYWGCS